jgi:UDPglucose 6-dehydrogenase
MRIAVIGTGYVGLVTGTCFADSGNDVVCVDNVAEKVSRLQSGDIPIYEPGLAELVARNTREGRLRFTTDLAGGIAEAEVIFIAVGTPQGMDGGADLSGVWAVGDSIARHLNGPKIIVTKSTVPVGTNAELARRMATITEVPFDVASNPEFLKEGAAIEDFTKPNRVVVGVRRPEVGECLHRLYAPFLRTDRPFLVMSPESAELTKYAANCLLATKISFINEMANLCEAYEADVNDVRRGIGHDQRIGFSFLFPGVGYGGSCFPKDIRAVIHMTRSRGLTARMMEAVDAVNEAQKRVLPRKILEHFGGNAPAKTVAVWGLAFKPRTDDIREAPALVLIDALLEAGCAVRVHDPEALANVRAIYGDRLAYCDRPYGALEEADALAIVTEWNEFRNPDFTLMARLLRSPVIFDGRNLYEPAAMVELGFTYYGIGRSTETAVACNFVDLVPDASQFFPFAQHWVV